MCPACICPAVEPGDRDDIIFWADFIGFLLRTAQDLRYYLLNGMIPISASSPEALEHLTVDSGFRCHGWL